MNSKELLHRIELEEQGKCEEIQVTKEPINYKKLIAPVISTVFILTAAILSYVFLLLPVVEKAKENPNNTPATYGIIEILPIVFMAIVLLGAIAYIFGNKQQEEQESEETETKWE